MQRDPVRAAIIGAGLMGRWHADALVRAGGRLIHVADPDIQRAGRLAAQYPGCQASSLLSDGGTSPVDVVHICTPTETHDRLVAEVLQNRMHALVEKPLASSAVVTARLFGLAASQNVLLCPVHQFLFQPAVLRVVAALKDIAPIRHIDAVTCSAGAADQPDHVRDAIAIDILPHFLSVLARVCPAALTGPWRSHHASAGELRMTTEAEGASVSITISMGGRPTCNFLRLIAQGGTVHVDLFHGFAVFHGPTVSRFHKIVQPFAHSYAMSQAAAINLAGRAIRRNSAYPGLRELIARFYDAVRAGGSSPVTSEEALAVATVRDAVVAEMPR